MLAGTAVTHDDRRWGACLISGLILVGAQIESMPCCWSMITCLYQPRCNTTPRFQLATAVTAAGCLRR